MGGLPLRERTAERDGGADDGALDGRHEDDRARGEHGVRGAGDERRNVVLAPRQVARVVLDDGAGEGDLGVRRRREVLCLLLVASGGLLLAVGLLDGRLVPQLPEGEHGRAEERGGPPRDEGGEGPDRCYVAGRGGDGAGVCGREGYHGLFEGGGVIAVIGLMC